MRSEIKGSCNRRCCYSPFIGCINNGNCGCHRPKKSAFELLAEEAARFKESDEK